MPGTLYRYAVGRIVFWVPLGLEWMSSKDRRHCVIPGSRKSQSPILNMLHMAVLPYRR